MSNQKSEPTLVACPACGSQVSNQAAACPQCGQPIAARYVHTPPQEPKMHTLPSSPVQNRPLTEWEKAFRMLGLMAYRLQKNPSTQKVTAKMGLTSLTALQKMWLVILAIVVGVIFLAALIEAPPNTATGNNGNKVDEKVTAESPTHTSQASPTVEEIDLNNPVVLERARQGERIYKRVEAKYHLPVQFSWQAENITLSIPTREWNSLTKEDQVNLSYYAEKLTSEIRANPKPYVDRYWHFMHFQGNTAPAYNYESYIEAASKLCPTCWKIESGKSINENGRFDFEPNDTVVSGATADAFRGSLGKELTKSNQEQDKEQSAEFLAARNL